MNLFFDTESTGLANFRLPANHPSQPRIVQLGAILTDGGGRVVGEMNLLVKPDGFTIPAEATKVHGISTEIAERYGLAIRTVVRLFCALVNRAETIVAHMVAVTPPGVTWSRDAIASVCGMSHGGAWTIEQRAIMKLRRRLQYTTHRQTGRELVA